MRVSGHYQCIFFTHTFDMSLMIAPRYVCPLAAGYKLYVRNIMQTFIPFAMLVLLNGLVFWRAKRNKETLKALLLGTAMGMQTPSCCHSVSPVYPDTGERKYSYAAKLYSERRAATRMLIAIIFTYLSSQLLNLVLTVWEFTDIDSLRTLWCRR